jgi:hypothetical protein
LPKLFTTCCGNSKVAPVAVEPTMAICNLSISVRHNAPRYDPVRIFSESQRQRSVRFCMLLESGCAAGVWHSCASICIFLKTGSNFCGLLLQRREAIIESSPDTVACSRKPPRHQPDTGNGQ